MTEKPRTASELSAIIMERLKAEPKVRNVASVEISPMQDGSWTWRVVSRDDRPVEGLPQIELAIAELQHIYPIRTAAKRPSL